MYDNISKYYSAFQFMALKYQLLPFSNRDGMNSSNAWQLPKDNSSLLNVHQIKPDDDTYLVVLLRYVTYPTRQITKTDKNTLKFNEKKIVKQCTIECVNDFGKICINSRVLMH